MGSQGAEPKRYSDWFLLGVGEYLGGQKRQADKVRCKFCLKPNLGVALGSLFLGTSRWQCVYGDGSGSLDENFAGYRAGRNHCSSKSQQSHRGHLSSYGVTHYVCALLRRGLSKSAVANMGSTFPHPRWSISPCSSLCSDS